MKKIIILTAAAVIMAGNAFAQQSLRSAYFLDGYNYRHEFNPAFASKTSYFSVPIFSSFNLETQSNLGVSTFLYPVNGQLTTFMNPSVSADEFLGKLDSKNSLNLNNRISLFSLGIRSRKSFFSFDSSLKTSTNFNLPYGLFDFMKNAGKFQSYEINDLSAKINSRMEFALGYGRQTYFRPPERGSESQTPRRNREHRGKHRPDGHPDDRRQMVNPVSGNIEILIFPEHPDQRRKRG